MNTSLISPAASSVRSSAIRRIFNRAQELEDVINFGIGEPDFSTPQVIIDAANRAMSEGYTHYTVNAGFPDVRDVIAAKIRKENGIKVDPDSELILTCGGMGGLFLALQSLVGPEDEVLVPEPCWLNYTGQISLVGGTKISVPMSRESGFVLTAELLENFVTEKTKLLMINTPSNPTGKVIPEKELKNIAGLARERDFLILSDEVYEKFTWNDFRHTSIGSLPDADGRTITVNSLSKTYAMTGWRIGYTCGPREVISQMIKLQENVYACPSSISQKAASAGLQLGGVSLSNMIEEYDQRRQLMLEGLKKIHVLKAVPTEGSFYVFVDVRSTGMNSEEFAHTLLDNAHVALVPGSAFGPTGEGFVRMSFATSQETILEGLERMTAFLSDAE